MSAQTATPVPVAPVLTKGEKFRKRWRVFSTNRWVILVCRVLLIAVLLGAWELFANRGWVDPMFTSKPSEIGVALGKYYHSGQMVKSLLATMTAMLIAFVIGTVTGALAGYLLGLSPFLDKVFGILIAPLNSIPRIALAPLFIIWFGLTMTAKVALAVSIVFFVLLVSCRAAVKNIDADIATMARVTGLRGASYLFKVLLPTSVPALFAGIRLALTYALLGVVASEMIASRVGMGQDIVRFGNTFRPDGLFAVLFVLTILATGLYLIAEFVEKHLLRWQRIEAHEQ
ncbi:ABC transporter permease [Granulicoccus phenolivorans]|uniref:ABC transporter permease n=1 Tax=Granulicoccus phenolivorans TaxID=266854 RepID=UPI0006860248|nr:ABC transporter permease [Granulicoccus phenolivorans]